MLAQTFRRLFRHSTQFIAVRFMTQLMIHILYPHKFMSFVPCLQKEVAGTLTMLEDIWDEYQVYENDEINYIDDSIKVHYAKLGDIDNE